MDKITSLIDQIIEKNLWEDSISKKDSQNGDSWNVYHLKLLKDLIINYEKTKA
jgi:hypothetical protein